MTLEERIKAIPGKDGFYKTGTENTFLNAATWLHNLEVSDDVIVDFLENLWYAVSNEYGN